MAKGARKQKILADKQAAKEARMKRGGMKSNYAKKKRYCAKHGVWGFQVASPKPWKGGP